MTPLPSYSSYYISFRPDSSKTNNTQQEQHKDAYALGLSIGQQISQMTSLLSPAQQAALVKGFAGVVQVRYIHARMHKKYTPT